VKLCWRTRQSRKFAGDASPLVRKRMVAAVASTMLHVVPALVSVPPRKRCGLASASSSVASTWLKPAFATLVIDTFAEPRGGDRR
jgi:hypothetical protein